MSVSLPSVMLARFRLFFVFIMASFLMGEGLGNLFRQVSLQIG